MSDLLSWLGDWPLISCLGLTSIVMNNTWTSIKDIAINWLFTSAEWEVYESWEWECLGKLSEGLNIGVKLDYSNDIRSKRTSIPLHSSSAYMYTWIRLLYTPGLIQKTNANKMLVRNWTARGVQELPSMGFTVQIPMWITRLICAVLSILYIKYVWYSWHDTYILLRKRGLWGPLFQNRYC